MFCDGCGTEIHASQRFCSNCGKPAGMAVLSKPTSRVAEHRQLLGILWIVYSVFVLIGGVSLLVIANTILAHVGPGAIPGAYPERVPFLQTFLSVISMLLLGKAVVGIAAGIGLLQREPWARLMAIILGFIAMLSVPFGTALGIYTIWVLLSSGCEEQYERLAHVA